MKHIYHNLCVRLHVVAILCLLVFTQCTTPQLSLQEGKRIEQLGVCLVFADSVAPEFKEQFETSLDTYIRKYNTQKHAYKLTECQDEGSVQIKVEDVSYTTSKQRATGIAVSTIGLIGVPTLMVSAGLPFYAFFYYFPTNQTFTTLALSRDLAHPTMGMMNRVYTSGGMFGSDERQRLRHSRKFEKHLDAIFIELERSYARTSRKAPKTIETTASTN
ncbi:hypothetical protein [Pontibacter fetidus]|uniref:Uncharacterized protein n=1 Tax=Pontibacter fetidus TaxID=2700082 RepID=A0A6B2H872_9BACT|nr:hypothetical protein [Pontibacter fetidus]NDK56200.1 hypothetical protein [Pontibacter fetidus]